MSQFVNITIHDASVFSAIAKESQRPYQFILGRVVEGIGNRARLYFAPVLQGRKTQEECVNKPFKNGSTLEVTCMLDESFELKIVSLKVAMEGTGDAKVFESKPFKGQAQTQAPGAPVSLPAQVKLS